MGQKIANQLYSYYTRNINEALSRGLGIPVFYRTKAYENDLPKKIDLNESERNAVILLVDTHAINNWKEYVKDLQEQVDDSGNGNRLFPVSISTSFRNIGSSVTESNFIRLHEIDTLPKRMEKLKSQLTHELCRMLYGKPRISELTKTKLSDEPVTLFMSHAKKDGVSIAKEIKKIADVDTSMNTFFDTIDIAPGHKFKNELEGNIEATALLAIQTDSYSSREWCRWEVLKAKKGNRPIVVVNAVKEGEERSFPYLGNVPTIRWKTNSNKEILIKKILDFTLYEVLRFIYTYKHLDNLKGLQELTGTKKPKILASPPELLTLLEKATETETKGNIVIYPDPPLTSEELELLIDATNDFEFLTPTFLAAYSAIKS
tara:strand:+ start:489 stop:1610 length:1122 start_codon:yes stop_codon:yes gene_type:complete